jgi:dCTP deaminase
MFTDSTITDLISYNKLSIHPFSVDNLNPASYDLTLHQTIRIMSSESGPLDLADLQPYSVPYDIDSSYDMAPGEFLLACTSETVRLSDTIVGRVEGKSSLARVGLAVHVTGGFIDPGFQGQITLEIVNLFPRPIRIYPYMRIAQIAFTPTDGTPARTYSSTGHYNGQFGPTESRYRITR